MTGRDKAKIVKGITDGRGYGGPYHVELQPSDACNIGCFFCATRRHHGSA